MNSGLSFNSFSPPSRLQVGSSTIFNVFTDPGLSLSIRNSTPAFVDFINKPENMEVLMDVPLTKKYVKDENYGQYLKGAIQILSATKVNLMSPIMMNRIYLEKMKAFLESNEIKDPKICGNFMTIYENMARYTQGEFIRDIPGFSEWLIDNTHNLAMRELLAHLMIDFPKIMKVNEELAMRVAKAAVKESGSHAVGAAIMLLRAKPLLIPVFSSDVIVEQLLMAIVAENADTSKQVLIFMLISKIMDNGFQIKREVVNKYSQVFLSRSTHSERVWIDAIRVLNVRDATILSRIVDHTAPSRLRDSILKQFQMMNDDELKSTVESMKLVGLLISSYNKEKYNTAYLFLVQLLKRIPIAAKGWEELVSKVEKRINNISLNYGGAITSAKRENDGDDVVGDEELVMGLPEGFGMEVDIK